MSVDGVYKSLPDQSGLTCSDDTMTNCHLKCKADVVNKQCDSVCIPTTLTGNPFVLEDRDIPLDKMCLVQNYQQCLEPMSAQEQEAAQSSLQACIKGCLPPCTRVRWSRRDSSSILHPKEKTNHVFKLYISNHAYPVFAQQYSWSLITVLSNVGGVAGVWLGASFVGVIHILAFIFKLCTAWMRTDEEDHDEESAGQGKDCAQKI
uniref:Uncharacterized protein n=1 Tax=Plectus sambesii TaxID=2011161 RepID=A0A914WH14_9BILA